MFESLIGLTNSIVTIMSKGGLGKPLKRRVGKDCAKLYLIQNEIIENADMILDYIEKTKKGIKYNPLFLIRHLLNQAQRIAKLQSIIKKSHIQTIFKIHLPQLEDLEILVGMKGARIAILTRQLKDQKLKGFYPVKLYDSPELGMRWWSQTKIVPATKDAIKKSRLDLAELKRQNRHLRKFIIKKFDIDEII
jgi:hypothetical protein